MEIFRLTRIIKSLFPDEQLPKIVGNDDLKNLIREELCSIRSQVENAVRSDASHAEVTVSARCARDTRGIVGDTAVAGGAIEVGNEVYVPTVRPLHNSTGSPSMLPLQTSRLDTEMREIRPHSVVQ